MQVHQAKTLEGIQVTVAEASSDAPMSRVTLTREISQVPVEMRF